MSQQSHQDNMTKEQQRCVHKKKKKDYQFVALILKIDMTCSFNNGK